MNKKTHKNQEWYHRSAGVKTTRRNSKFNKKNTTKNQQSQDSLPFTTSQIQKKNDRPGDDGTLRSM